MTDKNEDRSKFWQWRYYFCEKSWTELSVEEKSKYRNRRLLVGAVLLVLVLWTANFIYASTLDDKSRGIFGDMFGAVNALFSGLAFAGVIATVWMQKEELELQRKEIRDNRVVMEGQEEQLRLQRETMQKQQFESAFFQMLSLHNDIVSNMDIEGSSWARSNTPSSSILMETKITKIGGRDCFKELLGRFKAGYSTNSSGHPGPSYEVSLLNKAWIDFYEDYRSDLGQYFRLLYRMVRYVDESGIEDKEFYVKIIRSQLSDFEQALLVYNCLSEYGNKDFRPLVVKYNLTKHVETGELLIEPQHKFFLSQDHLFEKKKKQ